MNIQIFEDERGSLLPVEFKDLEFTPKRLFFINNVPQLVERGGHAHFKTKQILICVRGSVEVLLDDGKEKKTHLLSLGQSILIPEMVWDSQRFLDKDTEILVLCSTLYDKEDYIFDYDDFVKLIQ